MLELYGAFGLWGDLKDQIFNKSLGTNPNLTLTLSLIDHDPNPNPISDHYPNPNPEIQMSFCGTLA